MNAKPEAVANPKPHFAGSSDLGGGWSSLTGWLPVAGQGMLAVNAFLLRGREPVLIDTGLAALREPMLDLIDEAVGLAKLRWIWLSHADADHAGNLAAILERAPGATLVTNFLGAGKLDMAGIRPDRLRLVIPGESLRIGAMRLIALRPPYYDAPESMGFFDSNSRTLFAVDSFGALLPRVCARLAEVDPPALSDGLAAWSAIDAPWLADVEPCRLAEALARLRRLDATRLLSGHLPAATGEDEVLHLLDLARRALVPARDSFTARQGAAA
ncbi:MBL fold metallo-hydrolase [Sphingopyxis indica]|uniref:MBL fold metallo-hydrolase n=1 Tax=Sphingopyxis indica TaxID=436663 RepID=UPI002938F7F5|nr:MBL fold metallo-hydrolase [Sphingopyxis indica]WOF42262.1 MBL fold metallo-hydrolase [Sphingopyxis indica]